MNGIIFLYEMYDPTIDFPTPKYDAELAKGNKADIQLQVNISESKTKYGFSSYGRIMRINYNQTYSEIHLQIYRFFRTHFMLYLQSA